MGWMQRAVRSMAQRAAKYAGIPLRDPALVMMLGNQPTAAGVDVDNNTAMASSAVWQAVGLISSNIAAMPPVPYTATGTGRTEAIDHYSHDLLLSEPNPEMTPFIFYETLEAHALTWGNGYAYIERDHPEAPATALWPLMPNQTTPDRDDNGQIIYRFQAVYPDEVDRDYQSWEVLHIPGLGFDGLKGYDVIQQARESIGHGMAMEKYGAALFGRGSTAGGILKIPADMEMTERSKKNFRESWELMHRGPDNAHRVAILEDGIDYAPLGLPPEAAQFLQSRQFHITEIARWFNIPPHLLRDLSNATFSNIEHQGIDFLVYTLRPWLLRWAQELRRKLFTKKERKRYGIEHDTRNLLLTDINARYKAYRVGREGSWLTLNDILRGEKLPTVEGALGESRIVPENMRAVDNEGRDVFALNAREQVQNTAMNGAQIASMLSIVQACAAGTVNPDTANAMIQLAFPTAPMDMVNAMLLPIRQGKVNAPSDGGSAAS